MHYSHTQTSKAAVLVNLFIVGAAVAISINSGINWQVPVFLAIALINHLMFGSLFVSVDSEFIKIRFGRIGLIRKSFPVSQAQSCKAVTSSFLSGWGIKLLRNGTWLYSIAPGPAVEVTLHTGKRYRIGTDEPEKLEMAVRQALEQKR